MKNNNFKIWGWGIFLSFVFFLSLASNVLAEDKVLLLAPLPCVGGKCDETSPSTTLTQYIPGVFNLAIGISAAFVLINLVVGGFQYMSSDAFMKKEEGKTRIWNAIKGFFLVVSAWLILYTINPNLVNINLNIESIRTPDLGTSGSVTTGSRSGGRTYGPSVSSAEIIRAASAACPNCTLNPNANYNVDATNVAKFSCNTCGPVGGSITALSNNTNMNVESSFGNLLRNMDGGLDSQGVGWGITEAFPPTANHDDGCHFNGTCVDAKLTNPTDANIKRFIETARNNGLQPTYEVITSTDDANALASRLRALGVSNPLVVYNPGSNGAHFHVKR